jgi:hypothetical protein
MQEAYDQIRFYATRGRRPTFRAPSEPAPRSLPEPTTKCPAGPDELCWSVSSSALQRDPYTPIGCQVVLISVNASMKSSPCASSAK